MKRIDTIDAKQMLSICLYFVSIKSLFHLAWKKSNNRWAKDNDYQLIFRYYIDFVTNKQAWLAENERQLKLHCLISRLEVLNLAPPTS